MVKEFGPGVSSSLDLLANVGSTLFFATNERELWKSDGTTEGTALVKEICPGTSPCISTDDSAALDTTLFFTARTDARGTELWKSDGTTEGTAMIKEFNASAADSQPSCLIDMDGTLYFKADDGSHGNELWKSDGTEAGTVLVKDINPAQGSSTENCFTSIEYTLFLKADDGSRGLELWRSDGTRDGTVMVEDIAPGSQSSSMPDGAPNVVAMADKLFFTASDETHGVELWLLPHVRSIAGLSAANDGPKKVHERVTLWAQVTAGDGTTYTWECGDGHTEEGQIIDHAYASSGVYTATVTARNFSGKATAETVVSIEQSWTAIYLPIVGR
jgi:ELWxxDGT repeat protein